MNKEHKHLSHVQLTERIRKGAMFPPDTPGLLEAAREVLRPMVEKLEGQEILYHCRVLTLMRVVYVEVTQARFRVVATPIKYINAGLMYAPGAEPTQPLDFGGAWSMWYSFKSGIKAMMVPDIFYPDPTFVATVKAAAERGASPEEILALLYPEEACHHDVTAQ